MNADNDAFTIAFKKYHDKRRLTDLIGLQVLDNNKGKPQQEFVLSNDNGAIMLHIDAANITGFYRTTAYTVETNASELPELSDKKQYAKTIQDTHQVFFNQAGRPDGAELVEALRNNIVIG